MIAICNVVMLVFISQYCLFYRWLLLDFKREFIFMDSLRILEVLTSNHFELSSDRAAIEQEKAVVEEFAAEGMDNIYQWWSNKNCIVYWVSMLVPNCICRINFCDILF